MPFIMGFIRAGERTLVDTLDRGDDASSDSMPRPRVRAAADPLARVGVEGAIMATVLYVGRGQEGWLHLVSVEREHVG